PDRGVLRGSYDYNGYILNFEAIRGERNPIWDLTGPRFATHARLYDDQGWAFALQGGGHTIENGDWASSGTPPDDDRAYLNQEAAWALHRDLNGLDLTDFPGLEEQVDSLRGLSDVPHPSSGELPRSTAPPDDVRGINDTTPDTGVVLYSLAGSGYTHYFEIYWKPLYIPAEHSSTRSISADSRGVWVRLVRTCNHGSCPGDSGFYWRCGRSFGGRPADLPIATGSTCGTTWYYGSRHSSSDTNCCGTPYGTHPFMHVCNNDTRLQRDRMIALSPTTPSNCSFAELYAPSCW
ncbi:MAG TPA: hypothetical protein PKD27_12485, partial [Tepidiformaceae bacterium]|nr:hypothetical protein [Tepidiformaceae bacterium]